MVHIFDDIPKMDDQHTAVMLLGHLVWCNHDRLIKSLVGRDLYICRTRPRRAQYAYSAKYVVIRRQNVAWSLCGGGATAFVSGTYAENATSSMRNNDHVAGIGVRRLERRSSFPIPTPPPLGSRDIYDLLNKHFIWMSCLHVVVRCNEST